MGKIVVTEFVSLDGVMEDPGGAEDFKHGGWTFEIERGEEGDKFKLDELLEAEAQLLGPGDLRGLRRRLADDRGRAGFAEKMNAMPKYVVSSTLRGGRAGTTRRSCAATLADEVAKLKARDRRRRSSSPAAPSWSRG